MPDQIRPMRQAKLKSLFRISGRGMAGLFALSVPLGLIQGLNEIVFGFALLYFMASYDLVSASGLPDWLPVGRFNPIVLLISVGFLRAAIIFSSTVTSNLCYEGFNASVRRRVSEMLGSSASSTRLSVAGASNTLSNLLPRSSSYLSSLSQGVGHVLILAVTLAGLCKLSPPLSLVAIGSVAVFGFPVILCRRLFQGYSALVYANTKRFTERLLKDIRNLDFLRIVGRTGTESRALLDISRRIMRDYVKYIVWITANSSWPQFGALCIISIVVVMNRRHEWVAAAVLIPFVYMISRATASAGEAIRAFGNIQFNWPFVESLVDTLQRADTPAGTSVGNKRLNGAITRLSVSDLSIGRTSVLLEGLSFTIKSGDFVCFGGESGKGKTTLLMTLIGLVPSFKGRIQWNGIPVEDLDVLGFRNRVAYSGADPFLLDITVRENLLLGNENQGLGDDVLWDALRLTGCDFVDNLPKGLNYALQEGGEGISAGQKQRLSLARAILRKPEVLLLDEATANVDIEMESIIMKNLRDSLPGSLILAVSHRPSILEFATMKLAF